ncbi:MAG: histidinol dehydrogenase [Spirochaetota bacterium]|nr:MAG: histidinol dehydrogenase [Spirochaetota bacterium]
MLERSAIKIEDLTELKEKQLYFHFSKERGAFPENIEVKVKKIIHDVKKKGDEALLTYTKSFDNAIVTKETLRLTEDELDQASIGVSEEFLAALNRAIERVRRFHEHSISKEWSYKDEFGNLLGQKVTPIQRVGVYIPGGKAVYPSSLIMTVIPAQVAGVKRIEVVSPPESFTQPSVLAAAIKQIGNIGDVYRVGGIQGIAALALGTESVGKVDKIVGPGNIWVTVAKKILFGHVDIDLIAGPSEVLIVNDGTVDPRLTAIDLLAQAEHDEDAKAVCVTFSMEVARSIQEWVEKLMKESKRKDTIEKSLSENGSIVVVATNDCALAVVNAIAPEHLEIHTENPERFSRGVVNAGAIFLGSSTAEAFGDYIAGPSHVLPTGGTARFFSPLTTQSFSKFSSVVQMSKKGVDELGPYARIIAELEGLHAHAQSIEFRESEKR